MYGFRRFSAVLGLCLGLLCSAPLSQAGNLDAPAAPTHAGSALFTLQDLHDRLFDGTAGSKRGGGFTMPGAAPGSSRPTTDAIMARAPAKDDVTGASEAEVRAGKTFWGLRSGGWGLRTGTMTTQSLSPDTATMAAGLYSATTLPTVDTDLIAANIANSVSIFGITGSNANLVNTGSGTATAPQILSGKKAWVGGVEITGTAPAGNNVLGTDGSLSVTIPDGYYSGGKTVTAQDSDLAAGNILSGVTIFGTTGTAATATGDAVVAEVLAGKTFSNATTSSLTGTLTNVGQQIVTPGTTQQSISQGYHDGTGYVAGDADLVAGNIRYGVSIFGVSGDSNVVNTSTGTATAEDIATGLVAFVAGSQVTGTKNFSTTVPARVAKTGQTTSYAAGDDGDLGTGAGKVYPRFKDNGNGTVTDNLTGLIWLKNANCFGARNWATALSDANTLTSGSCGLSDGSGTGDWRLPNRKELQSIIDYGSSIPALPSGYPFTAVQPTFYWSSSTYAGHTSGGWVVNLNIGGVNVQLKANPHCVWPVRGGQ